MPFRCLPAIGPLYYIYTLGCVLRRCRSRDDSILGIVRLLEVHWRVVANEVANLEFTNLLFHFFAFFAFMR